MCGIIGYTGKRQALPILLEGLSALEYRGYDSAGVTLQQNGLQTVKTAGRLALLREKLATYPPLWHATCGIGHTRWATHGAPTDENAHPHGTARVSLVHNGIIENSGELAAHLTAQGYTLTSQTDTEVAALLIDYHYGISGDPAAAIFSTLQQLRGSFALAICFADHPQRLYAVCTDNPLIIAQGADGALIASDLPALLSHTKRYYRPEDGVLAVLQEDEIRFFTQDGEVKQREEHAAQAAAEAKKNGFAHFMLKEIYEQPEAIQRTVLPHLRGGVPHFADLPLAANGCIHVVACGTAMHAGLVGKHVIEQLARIPVRVEIASEFRYRDPILHKGDLAILLSQSGETADTLAALRHTKAQGIFTLAVVNVPGSAIAREADAVLYTEAGPEIAVASTKAYSTQCALLYLLALHFSLQFGRISANTVREICNSLLRDVPNAIHRVLQMSQQLRTRAQGLIGASHAFYIGRGIDSALCAEGSLKLKEITYIHSEAYPAGELKHGSIALIEKGTPVVALCTQRALADKVRSGIQEVAARGASVLTLLGHGVAQESDFTGDATLILPELDELLSPFVAGCALQLLAYHVSDLKGLDVDKPRNLAKSVTVE